MNQQVLVDTDIFIDFGRDIPEAIQTMEILERDYQICVSVIIAMELYTGCRSKKELQEVDDLLKDFTLLLCFTLHRRFLNEHFIG